MSALGRLVAIDRRFARSTRLDADLGGIQGLAGYVLQASVARAIGGMVREQAESGQGAFTWTGPYGGGKSSAVLLVASLVAGEPDARDAARAIVGGALADEFAGAFPEDRGSWAVVAVTGGRMALRDAVAGAAATALGWSRTVTEGAASNDGALVDALSASTEGRSGVLLVLDELGKLLEHEAATGGDAHLLQDLAERASRSGGRLVVIGVLHQSFDQYAQRADREARREWAKVQGRFHDVAFLSAADETVALLGRAISTTAGPASATARATAVAEAVSRRRPADVGTLSDLLGRTWPLNPITALLLGPVSRQRFAQNERSVFGFLSSAEPEGFQDFLAVADVGDTYDPARLWDYLVANFGVALAGGPDGGRFSLAFEAIERAGARGGALHVALTKSAAMIEFFRNGSGLALSDEFLALSVPGSEAAPVASAIADLVEWAVLIRQPRLGGYALFAGSDFDLDEAVSRSNSPLTAEELATVPDRVGVPAVSAKRHYFETGALRTFGISLAVVGSRDSAAEIVDGLASAGPRGGGSILLLLGDGTIAAAAIDVRAKRIATALRDRGVTAAVGSTRNSFHLRTGAEEIFSLERVLRDHPQLEGDRIARRELSARMSRGVDELHRLLEEAFETARWRLSTAPEDRLEERLPVIATRLADSAFPSSPVIRSELLQRDRPSSSAMAGLRDLLRAMVAGGDREDLGIEGFPVERGLYLTTLAPLGLHGLDDSGRFGFRGPPDEGQGATLRQAWSVLSGTDAGSLADVFASWALPPFGMRAGVMPVIALAYVLANRDRIALYVDDVFQPAIDDLVVDRLLQKPAALRLRRLDRTLRQAAFLGGLAERLGLPGDAPALPVARAVFQRFAKLSQYARRTERVSPGSRSIRAAGLKSNDPEALLFDALPEAMTGVEASPALVVGAIEECEAAYPALLGDVRLTLARVLGADPADFHGVAARAEAIRNLTNDYAFEAFCMRAAAFDGGERDVEGLASLLVHKPARSWSDRDREQALLELARFGRRFREAEALATVRERRSATEAVALVVGVDPRMPPLVSTFELTEEEKATASAMADGLLASLASDEPSRHLRLAALARAVASLAGEMEPA